MDNGYRKGSETNDSWLLNHLCEVSGWHAVHDFPGHGWDEDR
jgi:hypothetical protein